MKNKLNVIQINGVKGIIFVIGAVICLIAGFVAFPGMVFKLGWNFIAHATSVVPTINMLQGTLLWGIVVVGYLAFKGKGFFVEFKTGDDLTKEEMDAVMHRIRTERQADLIAKSIMRARELELEAKKNLDSFEQEKKDVQNEIKNN